MNKKRNDEMIKLVRRLNKLTKVTAEKLDEFLGRAVDASKSLAVTSAKEKKHG